MKKQLSSMDLYFLVKEFQHLIGGKMDQIYQNEKEELTLQFHVTGHGKQMLKIFLPSMLYITKYKGTYPQTPPGFCTFLRRRLKNARIQEIKQIDFERILELTFSTKDDTFHLIIELFSDGNVILCNEDYKIISPLTTGNWKDRTIRGGIPYTYPKRDLNILTIQEDNFIKIVQESIKESIVKTLALDFALGGIYAEEICKRSKVDKNSNKPTLKQITSLFFELQKLLSTEPKGHVFEKDVAPLEMKTKDTTNTFETFNEALDETLTENKIQEEVEQIQSKREKELEKINKRINQQKQTINEIETKIEGSSKKGELIYSNYSLLTDILTQVNKARETLDWKEIKEKLKGNKIIIDVNAKNKTVTVELKESK